jgi:hypothetical protein
MSQLPTFTENELQAYYRRADLINQTAQQIIKDFDWYGMEIKFSGHSENAYHELFEQINPAIEKLLGTNSEKLMEVLYRIDVNEKKVTSLSERESEGKRRVSELLTELIIQRELQKVVTRNYFSGRL